MSWNVQNVIALVKTVAENRDSCYTLTYICVFMNRGLSMNKRGIFFLLLFLCTGVLTGCGEVQDLTAEETQLIAEYAADLLLKYDLNYRHRISEGEKEAMQQKEEELEMSLSTEMETTEAPATEEEIGRDVSGQLDETENSAEEDGTEISTDQSDIADIVGIGGVSITYKDYLVTQQYPITDTNEEFIHLEASPGYQLLVLRFQITNESDSGVNVSLAEQAVKYRLVCNGTKAANPMLTILMDDLGNLDVTVNPGEEQEAVLVFQVADSLKDSIETIDLHVDYNNIDNMIKIL